LEIRQQPDAQRLIGLWVPRGCRLAQQWLGLLPHGAWVDLGLQGVLGADLVALLSSIGMKLLGEALLGLLGQELYGAAPGGCRRA